MSRFRDCLPHLHQGRGGLSWRSIRAPKLLGIAQALIAAISVWSVFECRAVADPVSLESSTPAQTITSETNVPEQTSERKTLTEFGQNYVLSLGQRSASVNTEEYILQGETAENWSQSIVYQRMVFTAPAAPDILVGNIKKRIEDSSPNAQLRLIVQGRNASIFAVHYAKTAHESEQVAIALAAVADPKRPNELHLIQFALRPERLDLATMESMVKRWQARFQSQAVSLNR